VNWAVSSIYDKATSANMVQSVNQLQFRYDNGNIYRYGYEEGCGFSDIQPVIMPGDASIIENGPVRITVQAMITVQTDSWTNTYVFTYSLVSTESFLRISVTGAAPEFSSVLTQVIFSDDIDTYEHGTPYHWDWKEPFPYGLQDDFKVTIEAVHDFLIPKNSEGTILGAIYHNNTPAWGVVDNGSIVYGVLLRNSPSNCGGKGAEGHDKGTHTVSYAVRVPSGFSGSATGQPIKEARGYHTPLVGRYIPNPSFSKLPAKFSLGVLAFPQTGMLTVSKPGEYDEDSTFLRVYVPDNTQQVVQIILPSVFSPSTYTPSLTTALEEPAPGSITWGAGNSVSYVPSGALSTVQLKPK